MSERLTQSSKASAPAWSRLIPWLLMAVTVAAAHAFRPETTPVIPDEAPFLYTLLPGPQWVFVVQTAALAVLAAASGFLVARLLPPKSPAASRALATAVGGSATVVLLVQPLSGALSLNPALPAFALVILGWLLAPAGRADTPAFAAGAAGLLSGLAIGVDSFTLAALIPVPVWLMVGWIRNGKTGGIRAALWLLGLAVGLLPVWTGSASFAPGWSLTMHPDTLRELFDTATLILGWISLPFLLLGFLAGVLQRRALLAGLIVPAAALLIVQQGMQPMYLAEQAWPALLPWAWLTAYGVFRLLRGVEQGVRNVNAAKAKPLAAAFTWITLAAYAGWAASLYLV